ncbi:MAG: hypothetical protein IPH20_00870 [Bacteroidales bacterium]|nr:hypothetical protein [Bacteroidales bacterium]
MKKNSHFNWYFVLAGALILYFGITSYNRSEGVHSINLLSVELSTDMMRVGGRRAFRDYKFFTKEYKCQFIFLSGSISRNRHKDISELKSGQKAEITIESSDLDNLNSQEAEVTVLGISANGISLLTSGDWKLNRGKYKTRILILQVFSGALLLLNGLISIPSKVNYVLVGLFAGTFIFLRVFDLLLY